MIRERLATLLPDKLMPYAKVVYGALIAVIGLLVTNLIIDGETAQTWSEAITLAATLLGVYEIPNLREDNEAQPYPPPA